MAESQFMRTVLFGGYDKSDVDKRINYLYDLCFDSKNKLREAKIIIDKLKQNGTYEEAINSALADDRAKLTEMQVKNQNLVEKARAISDENNRMSKEIADLKAKLEETETQLSEVNAKLASEGGVNQGAMLNVVFQQAQTSANLITTTAKDQAAALEADSKKLAENAIIDANNKAKMIVYEAEVQAADIVKEAKEKSSAMDVASENIKASILGEAERINAAFTNFKAVFDKFMDSGSATIEQSREFLSNTIKELTAGGIPVFKEPARIDDDLVDHPVFDEVDETYMLNEGSSDANGRKSNDTLQKLQEKAEAMNGVNKPVKQEKLAKKKSSLDDLMKKAESMQ